MTDYFLTEKVARVQEVVNLLQELLIAPAGKRRKFIVVSSDTSDYESTPLDAGYSEIGSVFVEGSQADPNAWRIVIRPKQGLDIFLPVKPMKLGEGIRDWHWTHVEHRGDFLTIVVPYFFYEDKSKVDFKKWCFARYREEDNEE